MQILMLYAVWNADTKATDNAAMIMKGCHMEFLWKNKDFMSLS